MARRSQSDKTLEGLIYLILMIPIGCFYVIKWIITGIVKIISACTNHCKKDNTYCADLSQVDSLDGNSFENYISDLLKKNGYSNVRVTKASGDFGVDVLGKKDNCLWAFQCKCYQSSVGVHAVQEVYSGASKYGADISVVVTNSHFTAAAKELAEELNVLLWDREKLIRAY